jgi:hypothetical protein
MQHTVSSSGCCERYNGERPHMKELIDMYSGPDAVTAKQQEEELKRVANTLPQNTPSSVNRFTNKMLLSLKICLNVSLFLLML